MWFTILFFIAIIVIWFILEILGKKSKENDSSKPVSEPVNPPLNQTSLDFSPYKARVIFFNSSERTLYDILIEHLANKYIILSKVRLEDIIESTNTSYTYRNRIKSSHIDFVLLDKHTGKVVCAIELDGTSHNNIETQKKDDFKNNLFQHVGITLHRIKVGTSFVDDIISLQL